MTRPLYAGAEQVSAVQLIERRQTNFNILKRNGYHARTQNFSLSGEGGADPEDIYNLRLISKIML